MLDKVVHNLTHRRFKGTSKQSPYELGTSVANSFFDPRNVGNFEAGEIAPSGKYLTHYPVNVGSNTAGFSIMDDEGDDRRGYYPSQVFSGENALVKKKSSGGSLGGPGNGSASDYIYFNPYYEALLNPQSKTKMEEIAQPHYLPRNTLSDTGIAGRGTNAPSSASAVDYAMNNPYAFKSNFNGGSLGAASSGSSSDYYDSNPNRVPAMQSETRHFTDFMTKGGAIDWGKYLGYIKTVAKHAPKIIEHAPKIVKTVQTAQKVYKDVKGEQGVANKLGAVLKHAPEIYEGARSSLDTVRELRGVLKKQKAPSYQERQAPAYRERQAPAYRERQAPSYREPQAPAYREPQAPAYREPQAPAYRERPSPPPDDEDRRGNIQLQIKELPKKKVGRPKKEKVEKPKGKIGRPKKELRTMKMDL
jgi:hypothetical protein